MLFAPDSSPASYETGSMAKNTVFAGEEGIGKKGMENALKRFPPLGVILVSAGREQHDGGRKGIRAFSSPSRCVWSGRGDVYTLPTYIN